MYFGQTQSKFTLQWLKLLFSKNSCKKCSLAFVNTWTKKYTKDIFQEAVNSEPIDLIDKKFFKWSQKQMLNLDGAPSGTSEQFEQRDNWGEIIW